MFGTDGGAVIFLEGPGTHQGLKGSLNPILATLDRPYLYTSTIAFNGNWKEPAAFVRGEKLRLTNADGSKLLARIIDIVGRSLLVEHLRPEEVKS